MAKRSVQPLLKQFHQGFVVCERPRTKNLLIGDPFKIIGNAVIAAAQHNTLMKRISPYVKSNVERFVEFLKILKTRNIPLIYASSSSVYGINKKDPFSESDRVDQPASQNAATNRETETLAHVYWNMYKLRSIGLCFVTVYGPMRRPDMAYYSFTKNISEGNPITVFNHGDMLRDFTYIDDIVDGVVNTLDFPFDCEILNLGHGQPQHLMTFIRAIEKEVGEKANINFKEMSKGDVFKTYADVNKARRLLVYNPKVALKDGIEKCVAWYKSASI
ncbi:UDP-glucuronate 4-epimerase [Mytilus galloprovincialis]|uniref:UDP-glucuronate 4-epimerase n=1 Tax=Mytilus galloprovincialis TaxID=29158 RepID=A0A8B6FH46_MYTGA|nr:UDP-glucuronate 4-epimerase [Mytilus galloprovincialis]